MPYTTIDNPELYFQTKTYTGTGSSLAVTFDGDENMSPDMVWIKDRDGTDEHVLHDSVRGVGKRLLPNDTHAEVTTTNQITSFDSNGFTVPGGSNNTGQSGVKYCSWNWNTGSSASSNSNGSITTSVSAGITQGFSIVSYTGNGSAGATVGHGLGATPSFYILKSRSTTNTWYTYNKSTGATKTLPLNTNQAEFSSSFANSTEPTSSVFSLGSASAFNGSGDTFIAYCFAEKKGYSKFGSYTGNGSTDGTLFIQDLNPHLYF